MICFNPLEKDDATETTTTLEFRHRYMQAKIGPKHLLRVMPNQKPWKPAGRLNQIFFFLMNCLWVIISVSYCGHVKPWETRVIGQFLSSHKLFLQKLQQVVEGRIKKNTAKAPPMVMAGKGEKKSHIKCVYNNFSLSH